MNSGPRAGRVYLVGAGPGDPELITVRGLKALRRADVVVYDRLVAPALLAEAPLEAERICAAKAPGRERLSQRRIEALLVARARAGRVVVRLKGGDPFVFGRGGEEAAALAQAGIPFEVIPGVSSALAVPAAAGIPVTHRGLADGFAVWTAQRAERAPSRTIDAPTQVILMGVETLPQTVARLVEAGRKPETPAAVISWGTTGRQRTVVGTLADIAGRAASAGIEPPATIVVGDVVSLAAAIGPEQPQAGPHAGMRVVVTRARREDDPLVEQLEREGAEVACLPLFAPVIPVGLASATETAALGRPAAAMLQCLYDLVDEAMVDAVVFDSERSLWAVQDFIAAARLSPVPFERIPLRLVKSAGESAGDVVNLDGLFSARAVVNRL